MTIEKASELLNKANIWAEIKWFNTVSFNGDYEDIYELTEQPRQGVIRFSTASGKEGIYTFDQFEQTVQIRKEPADLGIGYLLAMRTMAMGVAER